MATTRRDVLRIGWGGVLASSFAAQAGAQDDYPNKPIKVIVAAAAGGPTDVPARIASQILAPKFGQPVVVENRPGAGGALGARVVATSPPDGYTLLAGNTSTLAAIPAVSDERRLRSGQGFRADHPHHRRLPDPGRASGFALEDGQGIRR